MMRKWITNSALVALCWLLPGLAVAQTFETFGRNNYRNEHGEPWVFLQYEHVKLLHYNHQAQAEVALRLSLQAYADLTTAFDYFPEEEFWVYVFPDPMSFVNRATEPTTTLTPHTSPQLDALTKNGYGVYSRYYQGRPTNFVHVYYNGSYDDLNRQIRRGMARALLLDMFYGANSRGAKSNRLNLSLPAWFIEGLSAYVGEGWTTRDEMRMRSLKDTPTDAYLQDDFPNDPTARVVYKSLWYFIDKQYGDRNFAELVYMIRLTHSVDDGLSAVLSLYPDDLYLKWREYLEQEFFAPRGEPVDPALKALKLGRGRIVAAECNERLSVIAFVTLRGDRDFVQIYDQKRRNIRTLYTSPRYETTAMFDPELNFPLAWSANGNDLVFGAPGRTQVYLIYYNMRTRERVTLDLKQKLEWVNQIQWSPDGKRLVLSAVSNGTTDLFLTQARSGDFRPLTNDIYDDLSPVWSADGESIYFASNRDTSLTYKPRRENWHFMFARRPLDIYQISDFKEKRAIRRLTQTPYINETAPRTHAGSVLCLADAGGVYNLYKLGSGESTPVSRYETGMRAVSPTGKRLIWSTYAQGEPVYYLQDTLDQEQTYPFRLAGPALRNKDAYDRAEQLRKQAELKEMAPPPPPPPPPKEEPIPPKEIKKPEPPPQDTTRPKEEPKKNVRFYVFDEGEDTIKVAQPPPKRNPRTYQEQGERRITVTQAGNETTQEPEKKSSLPDLNKLIVKKSGNSDFNLYLKSFRSVLEVDPIFGAALHNQLELESPELKHRAVAGYRPFLNLRASDLYVRYQYLNRRFCYELGYRRLSRYVEIQQDLKFVYHHTHAAVIYPINRHHRVSFTASYLSAQRRDLFILDDNVKNLDATAQVAQFDAAYVYDKTQARDGYQLNGLRVALTASTMRNVSQSNASFSELRLDARHYLTLFGSVTLATRLSGGAFLGDAPKKYYLGGTPNWLISQQFDNQNEAPVFGNAEDLYYLRTVAPMRGFHQNARNGSHYALLNAELRFPLGKMFRVSLLPTKGQYNSVWYFFCDVGTAWDGGDPFSQRNPINEKTINRYPFTVTVQSLKTPLLVGTGTGIRFMMLGYIVRPEVGLGIEDGAIQNPIPSLSLGREF